ncbi:MAG: rane protein, partial [Proteobacteria bacterium]|nr:rane protein [Pseudomonadota bacterium]
MGAFGFRNPGGINGELTMLRYDMAWNEPGGGNRDPWSGGGREQGPPDLDEV